MDAAVIAALRTLLDTERILTLAVLVDGVWKITRATICQDLSLAGGDCGGDWQQIYPPGA